ncbi:MAG: hypothetical protein CMJ81_21860 [Planctomycetaceae bacterium]|jgi:hypothetical protein|nr:hypothetical protein [Planctomycetaceae bacterium]MBP61227.1 hypothetical protein [Planctomycetaceae bacterium]
MTWLLEDSLSILFVGLLIEAILTGVLFQTAHRAVIPAIIGVCLLFTGLLALEAIIVTEAESVAATLDEIAATLESNQPDSLLEHVSPSATVLRQDIDSRLRAVIVKLAEVRSRPLVTIHGQDPFLTAEADFRGLIVGDGRQGMVQNFRYFRRFIVRFKKEDGAWKVYNYEESSPL